jgi:hypothetical protein
MKSKRRLNHKENLLMLMVAALVLLVTGGVAASDPGEPMPGTVVGLRGPDTFWNAEVVAGTTVTYTDAPNTVYGTDISLVWLYHSADVFVTADITPSATITVTPQFSNDQSSWTDATYSYAADTLASTTSVVTTSGTTTATTTTSMSTAVTEATYRVVLSADATDYLRVPLAGKYLRFKIEHDATVTPTIKVLFRND